MTETRVHFINFARVTAVQYDGENQQECLALFPPGWQYRSGGTFFIDLSDRYYHEDHMTLTVGQWLVKSESGKITTQKKEPPFAESWEYGYQEQGTNLVWRNTRDNTFRVRRPSIRVGPNPGDTWQGPWETA